MKQRLFLAMLCLISAASFLVARPADALPVFSRRYGVPCQTCHTVAPQLNRFGMAFQANYFQWPGADDAPAPQGTGPLAHVPVSGMATFNRVQNTSLHRTSKADFRTLELYAAGSYTLGEKRAGGYFVDWVAANRDARAGDLGDAWAAIPVAGKRGQYAVMAGQFTPLQFQYDPLNSLTQSLPAGLAVGADALAFTAPTPGVRVDWFDRRGQATADGNYVSLGVPFGGHLTVNKDSRLYGGDPHGLFLHAFRRQGATSYGAFGFAHNRNHLGGLLATYAPLKDLNLLAAGANGKDRFGNRRGLSLEANYTPFPILGVTGRLENSGGTGQSNETFPVAAITVYPFGPGLLRLTGETVQQKGNRTLSLYAFAQF